METKAVEKNIFYTSSAGRSGTFIFALVKKAIFSLREVTADNKQSLKQDGVRYKTIEELSLDISSVPNAYESILKMRSKCVPRHLILANFKVALHISF